MSYYQFCVSILSLVLCNHQHNSAMQKHIFSSKIIFKNSQETFENTINLLQIKVMDTCGLDQLNDDAID